MVKISQWFVKAKFWLIAVGTFTAALAAIYWRKFQEGIKIGAAKERARMEHDILNEQVERKDARRIADDILRDARKKP